jgi:hypothetical protein
VIVHATLRPEVRSAVGRSDESDVLAAPVTERAARTATLGAGHARRSGGARLREGETHCATRLALERPVHGAGVQDEVAARPRMAEKELRGEHVRFETIARRTRRDDVARRVGASLGERMHVIERRTLILECRAAINTSATAVSHRGELECSLVLCGEQSPNAT